MTDLSAPLRQHDKQWPPVAVVQVDGAACACPLEPLDEALGCLVAKHLRLQLLRDCPAELDNLISGPDADTVDAKRLAHARLSGAATRSEQDGCPVASPSEDADAKCPSASGFRPETRDGLVALLIHDADRGFDRVGVERRLALGSTRFEFGQDVAQIVSTHPEETLERNMFSVGLVRRWLMHSGSRNLGAE